jgi:hypothetical protein
MSGSDLNVDPAPTFQTAAQIMRLRPKADGCMIAANENSKAEMHTTLNLRTALTYRTIKVTGNSDGGVLAAHCLLRRVGEFLCTKPDEENTFAIIASSSNLKSLPSSIPVVELTTTLHLHWTAADDAVADNGCIQRALAYSLPVVLHQHGPFTNLCGLFVLSESLPRRGEVMPCLELSQLQENGGIFSFEAVPREAKNLSTNVADLPSESTLFNALA